MSKNNRCKKNEDSIFLFLPNGKYLLEKSDAGFEIYFRWKTQTYHFVEFDSEQAALNKMNEVLRGHPLVPTSAETPQEGQYLIKRKNDQLYVDLCVGGNHETLNTTSKDLSNDLFVRAKQCMTPSSITLKEARLICEEYDLNSTLKEEEAAYITLDQGNTYFEVMHVPKENYFRITHRDISSEKVPSFELEIEQLGYGIVDYTDEPEYRNKRAVSKFLQKNHYLIEKQENGKYEFYFNSGRRVHHQSGYYSEAHALKKIYNLSKINSLESKKSPAPFTLDEVMEFENLILNGGEYTFVSFDENQTFYEIVCDDETGLYQINQRNLQAKDLANRRRLNNNQHWIESKAQVMNSLNADLSTESILETIAGDTDWRYLPLGQKLYQPFDFIYVNNDEDNYDLVLCTTHSKKLQFSNVPLTDVEHILRRERVVDELQSEGWINSKETKPKNNEFVYKEFRDDLYNISAKYKDVQRNFKNVEVDAIRDTLLQFKKQVDKKITVTENTNAIFPFLSNAGYYIHNNPDGTYDIFFRWKDRPYHFGDKKSSRKAFQKMRKVIARKVEEEGLVSKIPEGGKYIYKVTGKKSIKINTKKHNWQELMIDDILGKFKPLLINLEEAKALARNPLKSGEATYISLDDGVNYFELVRKKEDIVTKVTRKNLDPDIAVKRWQYLTVDKNLTIAGSNLQMNKKGTKAFLNFLPRDEYIIQKQENGKYEFYFNCQGVIHSQRELLSINQAIVKIDSIAQFNGKFRIQPSPLNVDLIFRAQNLILEKRQFTFMPLDNGDFQEIARISDDLYQFRDVVTNQEIEGRKKVLLGKYFTYVEFPKASEDLDEDNSDSDPSTTESISFTTESD